MSDSRPEKRKVEMIESYWTGGEYGYDYRWNDNHGELVRCRDCKHGFRLDDTNYIVCGRPFASNRDVHTEEWFCADGKKRPDL